MILKRLLYSCLKVFANILTTFDFSSVFCNWVHVIPKSTILYVLVNGHPIGYFACKRGVWQGNPLSPFLFCLAEDALNRCLSSLFDLGCLRRMASPRNFTILYHVLYTDGIMVFFQGTTNNLKFLCNCFVSMALLLVNIWVWTSVNYLLVQCLLDVFKILVII